MLWNFLESDLVFGRVCAPPVCLHGMVVLSRKQGGALPSQPAKQHHCFADARFTLCEPVAL